MQILLHYRLLYFLQNFVYAVYVSKLAFLFSEIREIIMMDEAVLRATTL